MIWSFTSHCELFSEQTFIHLTSHREERGAVIQHKARYLDRTKETNCKRRLQRNRGPPDDTSGHETQSL